MLFRLPIIAALAFTAQVGMAQSVQWSVGSDAVRWMSGFRNVQCGAQLHPEWGVVAGFGVRLYPSATPGQRVTGLIGLDYSQEVYQRTIGAGPSASEETQQGVYQYSRKDFRMLAGGRMLVAQRITLSAHVGVGYAVGPGQLLPATSAQQRPISRLLGVELMWNL